MFGKKALKDELPLSYTTRRENQWFKHIWFANWYKCHFPTFIALVVACVFSWKILMIPFSSIDASCCCCSLVLTFKINYFVFTNYRTFPMFYIYFTPMTCLERCQRCFTLPSLEHRDKSNSADTRQVLATFIETNVWLDHDTSTLQCLLHS